VTKGHRCFSRRVATAGTRRTRTPCALPRPPLVKCLRFASPASSFGALCHDSSRRPCLCPDCTGRLDPAAAAAAFHWQSGEVRPLGDAEMLPSQVRQCTIPAASLSLSGQLVLHYRYLPRNISASASASGPVWARERCRISPPRFLAECCKRQLNQGSFVLLYFRLFTFYRAMLCIRGTSHGPVSLRPSVCLSVSLSVTSRSSTKTAKRRITQTTPYDSPGTLVFGCQRSPRNSTGVTPYEGAECRWGGQNRRFSTNSWLYLENGTR